MWQLYAGLWPMSCRSSGRLKGKFRTNFIQFSELTLPDDHYVVYKFSSICMYTRYIYAYIYIVLNLSQIIVLVVRKLYLSFLSKWMEYQKFHVYQISYTYIMKNRMPSISSWLWRQRNSVWVMNKRRFSVESYHFQL